MSNNDVECIGYGVYVYEDVVVVQIKDWAFEAGGDGFTAPECIWLTVTGRCYGHPRHANGKFVKTSAVIDGKGKFCFMKSGRTYELLGQPRKEYLEWLESKGYVWESECPYESFARQQWKRSA